MSRVLGLLQTLLRIPLRFDRLSYSPLRFHRCLRSDAGLSSPSMGCFYQRYIERLHQGGLICLTTVLTWRYIVYVPCSVLTAAVTLDGQLANVPFFHTQNT